MSSAMTRPLKAQRGIDASTLILARGNNRVPGDARAQASASFDGRSVIMRTVPIPCLFEPGAERVGRFEAETVDLREVISPVGLSVRLGMVPLNSSAHSSQLTERVDHIADAVDPTAPHVDRAVDVAHHR